jgi:hypothetical protein
MRELNNDCVQCGHCCRVSTCAFGKWDEVEHQCVHLTEDTKCGIYNKIKLSSNWEINPAFGFGCSSTMFNQDREIKLRFRRLSETRKRS